MSDNETVRPSRGRRRGGQTCAGGHPGPRRARRGRGARARRVAALGRSWARIRARCNVPRVAARSRLDPPGRGFTRALGAVVAGVRARRAGRGQVGLRERAARCSSRCAIPPARAPSSWRSTTRASSSSTWSRAGRWCVPHPRSAGTAGGAQRVGPRRAPTSTTTLRARLVDGPSTTSCASSSRRAATGLVGQRGPRGARTDQRGCRGARRRSAARSARWWSPAARPRAAQAPEDLRRARRAGRGHPHARDRLPRVRRSDCGSPRLGGGRRAPAPDVRAPVRRLTGCPRAHRRHRRAVPAVRSGLAFRSARWARRTASCSRGRAQELLGACLVDGAAMRTRGNWHPRHSSTRPASSPTASTGQRWDPWANAIRQRARRRLGVGGHRWRRRVRRWRPCARSALWPASSTSRGDARGPGRARGCS